jgi:hypothetical protein|eukprot:COSAG06_NODE_118_length_23136_cov_18.029257_15_plen_508_part_00
MNTALHDLATSGDLDKVKDRLAQKDGARDLMIENADGCVPLHLAARHLDPSVAREMLMAQGGHLAFNQLHVKSEDAYGCFAMHRACYAGAWETVKAMLELGGEGGTLTCLHEPDADGYLPLQYATLAGRKDIESLMMSMDASSATKMRSHVDEFKAKHPDLDGPYSDGKLTVDVAKCVGLLAADTNGKSDPYVKLTMGDQSKQTKVQSKTLDPVFSESFTFDIQADADSWLLTLEVYDKDKMASDDFIGGAVVNLSEAFAGNWSTAAPSVELNDDGNRLEAEVAQQAKKRGADGVLHPYGSAQLRLSFHHDGASPEEAAPPAAASPAASAPEADPAQTEQARKDQEKKDKAAAKAKQLEEKKAALAAKKAAKKQEQDAGKQAEATKVEQDKQDKQAAKAKQLEEKKAALAAKKAAKQQGKDKAAEPAPAPADAKSDKAKQLEERKAALAAKKAAKQQGKGKAAEPAAAPAPADAKPDKAAERAKQLEEKKAALAAKKAERAAKKAGS